MLCDFYQNIKKIFTNLFLFLFLFVLWLLMCYVIFSDAILNYSTRIIFNCQTWVWSDICCLSCYYIYLNRIYLCYCAQNYRRCQSESKQTRQQQQRKSGTGHQQPKGCLCSVAAWIGDPTSRTCILQSLKVFNHFDLNHMLILFIFS